MTFFVKFRQCVILVGLGAASGSAFAGNGGTGIILGPPASGPGSAVTTAIPAMGTPAMIALGVLLAVVAFRFLRQKGIAQKVLSIALLGGGLVMTGLGVDKATATTAAGVPAESDLCSGGQGLVSDFRSGMGGAQLTNNCLETTLEVISYQLNCPAEVQIVADAGVGTQIPPNATVTMNSCPPPT